MLDLIRESPDNGHLRAKTGEPKLRSQLTVFVRL
jgi:hypothetical protein